MGAAKLPPTHPGSNPLPQGANLPTGWIEMLGGAAAAVEAHEGEVHRLGNLSITAYNSTLCARPSLISESGSTRPAASSEAAAPSGASAVGV